MPEGMTLEEKWNAAAEVSGRAEVSPRRESPLLESGTTASESALAQRSEGGAMVVPAGESALTRHREQDLAVQPPDLAEVRRRSVAKLYREVQDGEAVPPGQSVDTHA